jgi:hypothetical protein
VLLRFEEIEERLADLVGSHVSVPSYKLSVISLLRRRQIYHAPPRFHGFFLFFQSLEKIGGQFPFDRCGGGCKDTRSTLSGTKECMGYE